MARINLTVELPYAAAASDTQLERSLLFLHQQIVEEDKSGNRTAVNACRMAITVLAQVREKLLPRDAQDGDETCGRCGLLLDGQGDRQCYAGGSHSLTGDLLYDENSMNQEEQDDDSIVSRDCPDCDGKDTSCPTCDGVGTLPV